MATKNYFSGCEGQQHFDAVVKAGAEHCLQSYLYIRKQRGNLLKQRKRLHPNMSFMVDSGAHTLMESYKQKFASWSIQDFEDYCIAYTNWLSENRDYVDIAVELDIEFCLNCAAGKPPMDEWGVKKVQEWQQKYFRPLEETGMQIIYCWHEPRGMDGWEQMCSEFAYVGLPGELSRLPDFNKFITVAKRYTTKIHGFAATKQSDFRDWPWFSIDSTSWKDSERFGVLLHWDEHKQRFIYDQEKTRRHLYRDAMLKHGLPADDIIAGKNYRAFTVFALISMTEMEKFYQRQYAARTFYYELRLPHPVLINQLTNSEVRQRWIKLRGEELFRINPKIDEIREILHWLSMIQYRQSRVLNLGAAKSFLQKYFGGVLQTNPNDIQGLQKALANLIAPPNPPPIRRQDFIPTNNPPKQRDPEDFSLAELEWDIDEILGTV